MLQGLHDRIDRRQFIETAAALAGGALLLPRTLRAAGSRPARPTATDQVALGKTGLKLSRLGFGTGSNGGAVQRKLGRDGFSRLVRYAYDRGITYFDTADRYGTHTWVAEAIKGLPRDRLFIQSKVWGVPDKPLAELDRFRRELGVEYIDSVLLHCVVTRTWDTERKKLMDALSEAKASKIIRAHGVSIHSTLGMARAAELDWVDVALVRINPQGVVIDTDKEDMGLGSSNESHVPGAVEHIRRLRQRRIGTIGMKLIGDGKFTKAEDRERSLRFAAQCGALDAAVIGFKSPQEIDEAIERINRALAEAPQPAAAAT